MTAGDQRDSRMFHRAVRHVGRRGAFLTLFGLVYVMLGIGFLTRPPPASDVHTYDVLLAVAPFRAWGIVIITAGAVAVVTAVVRRGVDAVGYAGLQLVASCWAAAMAAAVVTGGNGTALRSAVTWAAAVAAVGIVAGWPEPPA